MTGQKDIQATRGVPRGVDAEATEQRICDTGHGVEEAGEETTPDTGHRVGPAGDERCSRGECSHVPPGSDDGSSVLRA